MDCVVDRARTLFPIEIKSAETINTDLFASLKKWHELTTTDSTNSYLIYSGDLTQKRAHGSIVSWKKSGTLIDAIMSRTSA